MLYQLHTGWVEGYSEGQEPIIYLVSDAQTIASAGLEYVFSDGHGIAQFTKWFNTLDELGTVDWTAVYADMWNDTDKEPDRQRRKQAEFLVYRFLDWRFIRGIGVLNKRKKAEVEEILEEFGETRKIVKAVPQWYY